MTFDLDTALKDSFYMIASFDETGDIIYKNNKFNMYFPDVKSKDDFMDITYEQEVLAETGKELLLNHQIWMG